MVERPPSDDPMVNFLASLGIEQGRQFDYCAHCGAAWPYCDWQDIVAKSPCALRTPNSREAK